MQIPESHNVVIVGGGICGLATALALHRKGIKSVVLERSPILQATGVAMIIRPNGWKALELLGVAQLLGQYAIPIKSGYSISVHDGKRKELCFGGELRCLRRLDIVKVLADNLPPGTILFGRDVVYMQVERETSSSIIQLHDGTTLVAKVVIGCDGVNSVTAKTMKLNAMKHSPTTVVRGFTHYQDGHKFLDQFLLWTKQHVQLGLLPINHKLIYWFLTRKRAVQDGAISRDQELIKDSTLASINGYPKEARDMVKNSDLSSLHLAELRYREPWELLTRRFRRGNATVAGDAMHAMGPFLAQGGSASLEDAVVLAKCLDHSIGTIRPSCSQVQTMRLEDALDQYLQMRKMRIFWLSLQSHLIEMTLSSSPLLRRALSVFLLVTLFRDRRGHTHFDPGCF